MSLFSLAKKTAVITGGSGGLGIAAAKQLLRAGASVALVDNNLPRIQPAAEQLLEWYKTANEAHHNVRPTPIYASPTGTHKVSETETESTTGGLNEHSPHDITKPDISLDASAYSSQSSVAHDAARAHEAAGIPPGKGKNFPQQRISAWACDVSDVHQVSDTVKAIREHHKSPLDILVNCAGFCENMTAFDYPNPQVKRLLDVNLMGSYNFATEVAKSLVLDESPGSLILVASMSGSIVNDPQPQTPYNMSKAGVIHMAKSLAAEWAQYNIRVNTLSPGYILTPLTRHIIETDGELRNDWERRIPFRRMAEPEEFGGPIVFMASDASSYMTGHDLIVDGGYTIW